MTPTDQPSSLSPTPNPPGSSFRPAPLVNPTTLAVALIHLTSDENTGVTKPSADELALNLPSGLHELSVEPPNADPPPDGSTTITLDPTPSHGVPLFLSFRFSSSSFTCYLSGTDAPSTLTRLPGPPSARTLLLPLTDPAAPTRTIRDGTQTVVKIKNMTSAAAVSVSWVDRQGGKHKYNELAPGQSCVGEGGGGGGGTGCQAGGEGGQ